MTDIVERLLAEDESARGDIFACAASEIERLRARVDRLQSALDCLDKIDPRLGIAVRTRAGVLPVVRLDQRQEKVS